MGENHGGGVCKQSGFGNLAEGKIHGVDCAAAELPEFDELTFCVHRQQPCTFLTEAFGLGNQIGTDFCGAPQIDLPGKPGLLSSGPEGCNQTEQGGSPFSHAGNTQKLLLRRVQNAVQTAEFLQQGMCQRVDIPTRDRIKQEEF